MNDWEKLEIYLKQAGISRSFWPTYYYESETSKKIRERYRDDQVEVRRRIDQLEIEKGTRRRFAKLIFLLLFLIETQLKTRSPAEIFISKTYWALVQDEEVKTARGDSIIKNFLCVTLCFLSKKEILQELEKNNYRMLQKVEILLEGFSDIEKTTQEDRVPKSTEFYKNYYETAKPKKENLQELEQPSWD